jgi:hypothetical protein
VRSLPSPLQSAEEASDSVIPSEARDLLLFVLDQEKADIYRLL